MSGEGEAVLELILSGEKFKIKALDAAHPRLLEVADEVNDRVKGLLAGGGALTLHRASLMAAFQFAFELKEIQEHAGLSGEEQSLLSERIERMIASIKEGLGEGAS